MNIDDIDWWVLSGTPYAVDTAGLTRIISSLQTARSELWRAELGIEECYLYDGTMYCSMPSSRDALMQRLAGMSQAEIDRLRDYLERQIRSVTLTRDLYIEAENTAMGAQRIDPEGIGRLFHVPGSEIAYAAFAMAQIGFFVHGWEQEDVLPTQQWIRDFALRYGLLINPTGVVEDIDGVRQASEIPAAQYVASSLLDYLGLDHFHGNLSLSILTASGAARQVLTTRDGTVTSHTGVPAAGGVACSPVTSMTDINDRILSMSASAKADDLGTFEVLRQVDEQGNVSWNVLLPGTLSWEFPPGKNPMDLTTNIQLVANEHNDLTAGVGLALQQLPIQPGEPVVFVGHSQGAIAASALASDPEVGGRLNTVGVVTWGGPTGNQDLPAPDVDVVHMINAEDFVGGLAGVANTNSANQATLVIDVQDVSGTHMAHVGDVYAEAYDLIAAEGSDPQIQDIQQRIAEGANWDGAVSCEAFTFQFERTDLDDLNQDARAHVGYGSR